MPMPICPRSDQKAECVSWRCGFPVGYVYGLLDARIGDIFYVGSTNQTPSRRYSAHVAAKRRSDLQRTANLREAWVQAILADGSLPVFLPLCEYQAGCETQLRLIENAIADELRTMGHTAICDFTRPHLLDRYQYLCPLDRSSEIYWNLYEHATAEYLDQVNEQARIQRWLREI